MNKKRKNPRPIDGGFGWVVVFSSFAIHFIIDGIIYTSGIFYLEFLKEFKTTETMASMVIALMAGLCLSVGPIGGAFINVWGCRVVGILGSIVATIGLAFAAISSNINYILLTYGIIAGTGYGFLYIASVIVVTMYFQKRRAFATGIAVTGSGFGTIAMSPITEVLVQKIGWRNTLLVSSCLVFLTFGFSALFRPIRETDDNNNPEETSTVSGINESTSVADNQIETTIGPQEEPGADPVLESSVNKRNKRRMSQGNLKVPAPEPIKTEETTTMGILGASFREMFGPALMRDNKFIIYTFCSFFLSIGFIIPTFYLKAQALSLKIASELQTSYLVSIIGIGSTLGRFLFGFISDFESLNRYDLFATASVVSGVSTGLSVLITEFWQMACYCFIFGFFSGAYVSLSSVILTDLFGLDMIANAFGLLSLFEGIATFVGPPLAGMIYTKTRSYNGVFIAAGTLSVGSGLCLWSIPLLIKLKYLKSNPKPE